MSKPSIFKSDELKPSEILKNFKIGGGEEKAHIILKKLIFISSIEPGFKINVSKLELQPPGILTSIYRSMNSEENKLNTIKFLQESINNGVELFVHYKENETSDFYKELTILTRKYLEESRDGIKATMETYNNCAQTVASLRVLLGILDAKLQSKPKNDLLLFHKSSPIDINYSKTIYQNNTN